ncbi:hypothetical protein Tco_0455493 [Tanacetum coccineum]
MDEWFVVRMVRWLVKVAVMLMLGGGGDEGVDGGRDGGVDGASRCCNGRGGGRVWGWVLAHDGWWWRGDEDGAVEMTW